MDLLELYAKITLDDSEFQKGMKEAAKTSKNVKSAVQALQSPFDQLQKSVNAAVHPIETAKNAFQNLKEKTEAIRHPIEAIKNKINESSASVEQQRNHLESLANRYESTKNTVAELSKKYNESVKETGKYSEESRKLTGQLTNAEESAKEAKDAMEKYADSLLKSGKESDETEKKTSGLADKLGNGLAGAAKTAMSALSAIAKVGSAAIGSAITAVGTLTKASIDAYGNYEQLTGDVETLYGTEIKSIEEYAASIGKPVHEVGDQYESLMNRQGDVLKNAANAYKTAGLSSNEYMKTVTGFADSLTSSLGEYEWQAASYADMIVTDMADNANKMGSSLESIQNAYAGFSEQNFTMLDNLKLGYGGTQEEMERLMRDAEKYAGFIEGSLDIGSFADIAQAINIVQTELGIAGTAAQGASSTMQGSLAAMKSAWGNLVTGIADENADLGLLVGNVVDSMTTAGQNIVPHIEQILKGIGSAFEQLVLILQDELPGIISEFLPNLLNSGSELLTALLDGIIVALPALSEGAQQFLSTLVAFISENFPVLLDAAIELIRTFGAFIIENLPMLIEAALDIILQLANGISESLPELIPAIVEVIMKIVEALTDPEMLMNLIGAALTLIIALAEGLIKAMPKLMESIPTIVMNIVTALIELAPQLLKSAWELIIALADGLISNAIELVNAAGKMFSTIKETIEDRIQDAVTWGKDLIQNFINGIMEKWNALKEKVKSVAQTVKDFLGFSEPKKGPLSNFHTYAPDMMNLFAKGIAENAKVVQAQLDKSLNFDFGKASLNFNASITKSATQYSGLSGSAYGLAGVNITINGAQYKDEASLAQRISQELYNLTMRRSSIYATGL